MFMILQLCVSPCDAGTSFKEGPGRGHETGRGYRGGRIGSAHQQLRATTRGWYTTYTRLMDTCFGRMLHKRSQEVVFCLFGQLCNYVAHHVFIHAYFSSRNHTSTDEGTVVVVAIEILTLANRPQRFSSGSVSLEHSEARVTEWMMCSRILRRGDRDVSLSSNDAFERVTLSIL